MPIERRFNPVRVIGFLLFSTNSAFYLATLGLLIGFGLIMTLKKLPRLSNKEKYLLTYSILLLILTVYAVLQAGNDFQHYKLYLLMPLLLATALIISMNRGYKNYFLFLLLAGSILQTVFNVRYLDDYPQDSKLASLDQKVIGSINRHSRPVDRIVVWGWRDQLHVWTRRAMGYRNVHPFHFSMKSPLVPFWTREFLQDMEANKPKLFIEAMVPKYSERAELWLSHEKVPVINEYVRKHYRFVEEVDHVKVFARR